LLSASRTTTSPNIDYPQRLDDRPLRGFIALLDSMSGIKLSETKRSMLYTRLLRRLRARGVPTFEEYLTLLRAGDKAELEAFVNVMTTNLTYFYREPHHFDFLEKDVVPKLFSNRPDRAPVRIWSSACSSGEEPYSIAMALTSAGVSNSKAYRLLCTDLNTEMVQKTKAGVYRSEAMRGLSESQLKRWFTQVDGGRHLIKPALQESLICKKLNLFDRWPIAGLVDIIFCRNVLIYFAPSEQEALVERFARIQDDGAFLFLGHSEAVRGIDKFYERVGNTIFRRLAVRAD